ncbi:MAG: asparagine synthase (glutamine-hydrolyzing) [Flavobacteriales bacterium]|nr:asparagine synthase (glutamine-hydrolyzing) [Flavobacteriales bacterium]
MCGIVGYISNKDRDSKKMLEVLHHRGPDSEGVFDSELANKKVFLGHKRLSIIDLSEGGNQPMLSEDQQIVLTFNGEIYNFLELKNTVLKGHGFKSNSDTEVLLKLYELKGIDFLEELNGDFAISILDKNIQKMFVIRDRVGVKPLYYFSNSQDFIYGSEIKSILSAGIKAELNKKCLQQYFTFKYVPENNTLFKDIYRVPAAHYLTYDFATESISKTKYWEAKSNANYSSLNYSEAKEAIYELIEDACRIRLISDVPVGTFFSGGLDSSIIAHFVKGNKNIIHYCAGKNEKDLKKEGTTSDSFYAKKLAEEWGMNLELLEIGGKKLSQELIRKTVEFSDDIIADGSQIPSYLITQKAAKKSTVILSGMGADELFLGYAGHQLLLLDKGLNSLPKRITKPLFKGFASLNVGSGSFKAYKRYLQKLGNYNSYGNERFGMYNVVGDFESSTIILKEKSKTIIPILGSYFPEGEDAFDGLKKFEWNNFLIKNLHYTDRMSMANSVENRVPFLDHRIVEFASSIQRSYKLSNTGKTKRILKDTFSSHLPNYVTNRRKAGFGMPLRSLLSERQHLSKLLDVDFFNNFEDFSIEGIELTIDQHMKGIKDNSALIYALITFQEWYKMYIN